MKKTIGILLSLILAAGLGGCGQKQPAPSPTPSAPAATFAASRAAAPSPTPAPTPTQTQTAQAQTDGAAEEVDLDLTTMSSTMVYAEVFNIMDDPSRYEGQTIRAAGPFVADENPQTGEYYFGVLIMDATACCSQGVEFALAGENHYPEDYPEPGEEITVTGVLETYGYEEYGVVFCRLVDAHLS